MVQPITDRPWKPLDRNQMAARVARDIPEGWYVNLGIGIPTMIANHIPPERETILHSENGLIGMGRSPPLDRIDPWLVNAGKQHVTVVTGGSFCDQSDSFAIIRGGHLDLCVLGAFEVSEDGSIANWATSLADAAPGVGGAMDLAVGAKRLWVVMEHTTKTGQPRLKKRCASPVTATGVVTRIFTNLAVIEVTPAGFMASEIVPNLGLHELQSLTEAKISLY